MAARAGRRDRTARATTTTATTRAAGEPLSPAARALWLALAATLALRVAAALLPGRALWGLDLGRDLATAAFLLPLAATALLLVPALARPIARALPASPRGTGVLGVALALLAGALALAFPDVLQFTGDSGMRHGAFATTDHPLLLVPQAMPGDLWLHWALPRWMDAHAHWPAERTDRAIGALLAVANGLAAWRLARALRLTGGAALAVMAIAGWTACLALFSGYAKSLVDLAVLELAAAAALASVANGGGGLVALGLVTAIAIVMHRLGLALVPAWLAGLAWSASRTDRPAWSRPAWLAAAALPVATLAWLGPRLVHTLTDFDVSHHVTHDGAAPATIAAQLLAPSHLADVANLLLLLVPALPLAAALVRRDDDLAPAADAPGAARGVLTAALVLPPLALALVLRPQQGLFRDWDVFAIAGVAIAAWLAARVGARLSRERAAAWLAPAIALATMVPATQWLAHQADFDRGAARARAILLGPPRRSGDERARGFDRLSLMHFYRGEGERMAEACSLSVDAAPNPRVLAEWGMAETLRQNYPAAQSHYLRAASLNPGFTMAWKGVAASSSALGDVEHMAQAVQALERLEPGGETVRQAAEWLQRNRPAGTSR